jgi:tagatose-1,6-bisphosphate aldolase
VKIRSLQFQGSTQIFLVGLDSLYGGDLGMAQRIAAVLQPSVSGFVLDPVLTFPGVQLQNTFPVGLALRLEKWAESDPLSLPALEADWGVEAVRQNSAVAKLSLWYHPMDENAQHKRQFLIEIHDYCRHLGIDLLLEVKVFEVPGVELSVPEVVLRVVEDVRGLAEAVALPWVEDALTAATVTAELDVPWLISWGAAPPNTIPYDLLKDQLRQALESGAAGCLVGSHLWAELEAQTTTQNSQDPQALSTFIHTTLRDRAIELSRLIKEAVV